MAGAQENIEYLPESEDHFGNTIPLFTRKGSPESRKKTISVRLLCNRQVQKLEYRRYRSTESNYATLWINGLTYIVMALPQGWQRGDKTDIHGGCRWWFAWQGPLQQFVGERFQGPVAESTSRSERSSHMRSDSMSNSNGPFSHPFNTSRTSPIQRSLQPSPSPLDTRSSSASADYLPNSQPTTELDEQEPAESHGPSTRRTKRGSIGDPDPVLPSNPVDPSQTLMPQEETAIWMRICVPGEENRFRPMFLGSARPSSDVHGPVTHTSLFEKVAKVCMLDKPQIQYLEVIIDERAIFKARHSPRAVRSNQIYFRVGREEEESWQLFVICLKDHIAQRHGCDGWHLVILAHVPT